MNEEKIKSVIFNSYKKRIEKPFEKKDKDRKRVESENWKFSDEYYLYESQIKMIKDINNNNHNEKDEVIKIILQQINKKIYGYKQQDILKKKFQEKNFINLESILNKMVDCELKCYYCKCEMNVLYDISREMKQWTVDRIDNGLGHNLDNYYLACLDCNLKRRTRNDEKFLFTKQLKIVKTNIENN
jgi:hypothetical protein